MTQIITLLTQHRVFIAADCRLAHDSTGTFRIEEDDAAKLICLGGTHFMAYAGSSKLGGVRKRTEMWVAEKMYEHSRIIDVIQEIQATCISAMPRGVQKVQHFAMVGFSRVDVSNLLFPVCVIISNHIDSSGRRTFGGPMRTVVRYLPRDKPFTIHVGGIQPKRIRRVRLRSEIEALVKQDAPPATILRRLVQEIRFTAARNKWVSARVLAASIPRYAEESKERGQRVYLLAREPEHNDAIPTFCVYDGKGSRIDDVTRLYMVKNDIEGRWIVELVETRQLDKGYASSARVIKVPTPGTERPPAFSFVFGDGKIHPWKIWDVTLVMRPVPSENGVYWMRPINAQPVVAGGFVEKSKANF